jgi:DNA segregation ATPase FtsK/SpoIIIE, S-DNA-T family
MATRRRTASTKARTNGRRTAARRGGGFQLPPQIWRSLLGLLLLVIGAVTLVALLLPQAGILNRYVADVLRPAFGQGAWLLAVLLIVAGAFVERAPKIGNGWSVTAVGGVVVFIGGLGLIHLLWGGRGGDAAALSQGGGAVGRLLSASLSDLVSPLGAFFVLLGLVTGGLILMLNVTLVGLLRPVTGGGRLLAGALAVPARQIAEGASRRSEARTESAQAVPARKSDRRRRTEPVPVMQGADEGTTGATADDFPAPMPSPAPISQTVWAAGQSTPVKPEPDDGAVAVAVRTWDLPGLDLLEASEPPPAGQLLDHARNVRIIEEKLRSFQIPATVTGTNTGPVVTQYEVRPDARIKLSRIEGLADDLAMALAARSIRIEAPIPGRDVVGIEIPNHSSEIVSFRRLVEDAGMTDAASRLTFALGRDVSGKAYAVDLVRMPHLLIAGATGSGKSVCVNALITSLLMRATPEEVRLILVDLKRVELAAYRDLPHLETPVIVESHETRAVLTNMVGEMEQRYERLAEAMERNIGAYNASPRRQGQPMPYIVVVIDELADLILREGRKVEDPIVKLAQKARAVGIHLVLATQRPSVNVVTGLIKANVPSRIAFAMASNVDSRTVLDAPGAEDLIGRGDMLYQPADLPRPVRLQGVFVSDAEVRAVTEFWRAQAEPTYNRDLLQGAADGEDGEGGQFAWLARQAEDELAPRAAELVMQTGRASTSMMQTKLKVGFNRATRLMDELEKYGIVGPLDARNPAAPRQVYGPDNWLHGAADADAMD